jgi:hypothetical protein
VDEYTKLIFESIMVTALPGLLYGLFWARGQGGMAMLTGAVIGGVGGFAAANFVAGLISRSFPKLQGPMGYVCMAVAGLIIAAILLTLYDKLFRAT